MRVKIKEIRLMALFLFGLTIVKFFIVDFWRMDTIGKIVSFLVIGAVLILVSQLYRKQLEALVEHGELALDKDATLTQEQAAALARAQRIKQLQDQALAEASEGGEEGEEEDFSNDEDFEEEDLSRVHEVDLPEGKDIGADELAEVLGEETEATEEEVADASADTEEEQKAEETDQPESKEDAKQEEKAPAEGDLEDAEEKPKPQDLGDEEDFSDEGK